MLVSNGRGCLHRTIFKYHNVEQRQTVMDHLEDLPGKVHAYDNSAVENTLICDFQKADERDAFYRSSLEF